VSPPHNRFECRTDNGCERSRSVGFIGLGNRGDQVLSAFLEHKDAEVVAVCDIYRPYLDFAAKKIGGNPSQFHEYRKLLERKDLDAVVVATPDTGTLCKRFTPAGRKTCIARSRFRYALPKAGDGEGGPR